VGNYDDIVSWGKGKGGNNCPEATAELVSHDRFLRYGLGDNESDPTWAIWCRCKADGQGGAPNRLRTTAKRSKIPGSPETVRAWEHV